MDEPKETLLKDLLATKIYSEAVEHQLQEHEAAEEQVRSQDAGIAAASTSAVEIQVPGQASLLVKRLGRRSETL